MDKKIERKLKSIERQKRKKEIIDRLLIGKKTMRKIAEETGSTTIRVKELKKRYINNVMQNTCVFCSHDTKYHARCFMCQRLLHEEGSKQSTMYHELIKSSQSKKPITEYKAEDYSFCKGCAETFL